MPHASGDRPRCAGQSGINRSLNMFTLVGFGNVCCLPLASSLRMNAV